MSASVETYGNRADWLRARKTGIGASEMAAVMGISPYASPYSVWAEKVTDEIDDRPPTGRQYWGTRLEGLIADEFAAQMDGVQVQDPGPYTIYRDAANHMFATPDRLVEHADGTISVLELKTAGLDRWHDWDACPPAQYLIQVQHQIAVTGAAGGYIAVLIGGNEFRIYPVPRDDAMIADIRAAAAEFWASVERREPPEVDGSTATSEAIKRMYPESRPGPTIALPDEAISITEQIKEIQQQEKSLKAELSKLKEDRDRLENEIRILLGDHESGAVGPYAWSWKTANYKGHIMIDETGDDVKGVLQAAGITYKETEPSTRRTLRLKVMKDKEED